MHLPRDWSNDRMKRRNHLNRISLQLDDALAKRVAVVILCPSVRPSVILVDSVQTTRPN